MKYVLTITLLVVFSFSFSQTKGKITYSVSIQTDSIEKKTKNIQNLDLKDEVIDMYYNAKPVESYLVFNNNVSLYYVEDKDEIPVWNNNDNGISITPSDMNITWAFAGGSSLNYTDWSRNYFIQKIDVFGKPKRIKQVPEEWIKKDSTKIIEGYKCKLAVPRGSRNMQAWYTEEIPLKHGPNGVYGLPGLILELQHGTLFNYKAKYIDFDTSEADVIKEPEKGTLITKEDFEKLMGNPFDN